MKRTNGESRRILKIILSTTWKYLRYSHIIKIKNSIKAFCLITLFTFGFLLFLNVSYAEDSIAWVGGYASPGGEDDKPGGIFIDSSGKNIYVVGYRVFCDTLSGTDELSNVLLIKFDSLGQRRWVRTLNGLSDTSITPVEMIMDKIGNIYYVGYTMHAKRYETRAFILLKYDSTGQGLWKKTIGLDSFPLVVALYNINLDESLNIYVCGACYRDSGYSLEIRTIKYKPNGDIVWTRTCSPPGYEKIERVYFHIFKIDDRGNIFLTGEIDNAAGDEDFCIMKIDSLGNTVWVSQYNIPENLHNRAENIETDNEGNIYVAGQSQIHKSGGEWASRLIKYDSLGRQRWVRIFSHPTGTYEFGSMSIEDDNIYVTGTANPGSWDTLLYIVTVKYDTSGNYLWIKNYKDQEAHVYYEGSTVKFDKRGNMYVLGISGVAGDNANDDILLIKYWGR